MSVQSVSPNKSRKLAIFGAYGGVNLGDEMILRAITSFARGQGYQEEVNVIVGHTPNQKLLETDYSMRNLDPISYRRPFELIKGVWRRDLFIGGGQIIDGVAGIQLPLLQVVLALVSKVSGGQVSVLGASVARLNSWYTRKMYQCLFVLCSRIELRDEGSSLQVRDICPSARNRIKTTADLVFGIRNQITGVTPQGDRKLILFAPHHAPKLPLTSIEESVVFLQRLHKIAGDDFEIAISVHDVRPEFDYEFAQKLIALTDLPDLRLIKCETTDSLISCYRNAHTVVSVRMHPIIIGACAGALCIPISGSRKQLDLADLLSIKCLSLEEINALSLEELKVIIGLNEGSKLIDDAALAKLESQALKGFENSEVVSK